MVRLGANRRVGENERGLTDDEIATIVSWVEAGAPAGDMADAPAPKQWAETAHDGWTLGTPDLVVKMDPYLVEDDIYDPERHVLHEDRGRDAARRRVGARLGVPDR